jgi:nicotinamidase-related amidase
LEKPALLIIDMQHDFVDPDGPIPCQGAPEIVPNIRRLIEAAHNTGVPCIYTKELHRPQKVDFGRELDGDEPVHCLDGTRGAEIVEELTPQEQDYVIPKRRYSGFFGTDLQILLKGIGVDTLFITGAATDICVYLTAMDAHQYDFKVRIPQDCVAGSSQTAHQAALASVERQQKGAIINSSKAAEAFREFKKNLSKQTYSTLATNPVSRIM